MLFAFSAPSVNGQLTGRINARPIGVGYVREITQVSMVEYMERLGKRLEVGGELFKAVPTEQIEGTRSGVEIPVSGVSWHMVQGLIPSFKPVYFQEVVDLADARRIIESRKKMFGERGRLSVEENDCFRLMQTSSWTTAIPDMPNGQTPEEYVETLNSNNGAFQNSAKIIEKDGNQMIEQSWTMTEYYRYHDALLFNTSFEELREMELPSKDSLTSTISSANDLGLEAFFDRIPMAIKQLGWNMLNSTAGTQMQQRDGEEQVVADLRRTSIDMGIQIVRAVMFDVQQTNGWIRFATEEDQSVRGEINFEPRHNSGLTVQLEELSSGVSRFAPILNDEAAGTMHLCCKLSEDAAVVPRALADWMKYAVDEATFGDPAMLDAMTQVAGSVSHYGDRRVVEAFLKVGWTPESGGVIYGGLQVDDNPNLLRSLVNLVLNSDAPDQLKDLLHLSEIDGFETLQVEIPPDAAFKALEQYTSLKPTHFYVTHRNSCLWFALGGGQAVQMLNRCVERCEESVLGARAPLFTAKIDVDQWLNYPADQDPTGIAGALTWLDANRHEFPPSLMTMAFASGRRSKPTPLLQKCLDLGGDRTAAFRVIADKSGVRVSTHIGEAVANYYLARMMDVQESFMRERKQDRPVANDATDEVYEVKELEE